LLRVWCKRAIKGQFFYIFSFPLLESISLSDKSDKMERKKKEKKKTSLSGQFQNPIRKSHWQPEPWDVMTAGGLAL
jgi:hypothetical protein